MSNKPLDETDVQASDEIIGEIYSTLERWIIFIVIYVVSLILCSIYLFWRVDVKQFSFPIFALCLIYSSFFVMLNEMALFDLFFSNEVGMVKFIDMISIFYEVFNWIDKICGYIIFNLLIAMMESGYFCIWKKFFDYWIRIGKSIPNNLCEIIVRLIIAGGILTILIMFRERFNLGNNPFDYFSIILDVFGMLEIYSNVGFFMLQIILDFRRKKSQLKINRYDLYSKIKIMQNIEKYMEKVKDSYNELKKDARIFEKNDHPDYHKYLQKIYKEMEEKLIEYGYELNDEGNNLNFNNFPNNNTSNNYTTNDNNNNPKEPVINTNINKDVRIYLNQVDLQSHTEQLPRNMETDNNNDRNEVKKEDFDTSKNIRKFKKAVRKINKLKKLYKEIHEETNEDLKTNKKCTCGFIILFVAFTIALITDFLLPIALDPEDDFTKSAEEKDSKFSMVEFIIFIIVIYPVSVITSSYTLIMIYSTKRKNYISGDYLYDKQINDNISLLKTVQIICGYSFSILYCNIYFWRTVDTHGHYGKPKFYETTFIPDYTFKQGITVFMIAKIILIVSSIIGSYYFSSCDISCKKCKISNIFENDLGEFDRSDDSSIYANQTEFTRLYVEKGLVVSYLERKDN